MGGAGIMYPMLALIILNMGILLVWILKGRGIKKTRIIISLSAIFIFSVFMYGVITLESMPLLRDVALIGALMTPIISLFLPSIHKYMITDGNT